MPSTPKMLSAMLVCSALLTGCGTLKPQNRCTCEPRPSQPLREPLPQKSYLESAEENTSRWQERLDSTPLIYKTP